LTSAHYWLTACIVEVRNISELCKLLKERYAKLYLPGEELLVNGVKCRVVELIAEKGALARA
jgi:hypothetical protein